MTDEQIAREEKFLEGIPRLNVGALFLPPIWGPAHGMWAALLFYPIWLFADNTFYAAWTERTPLALIVAAAVFATLTAGTSGSPSPRIAPPRGAWGRMRTCAVSASGPR